MSDKRILIEISGGDADGRTFDSQSTDLIESHLIEMILGFTRNGKIGEAWDAALSLTATESSLRGQRDWPDNPVLDGRHRYVVFERDEDDGGILIRIRSTVNR